MTQMPSEKDIVSEARRFDGWAILAMPPSYGAPDKATFDGAVRVDALLSALADEVERLLKQQERDSTCIVCSALLLTDNSNPPHCIDCRPTEEDRERWEANED